MRKPQGKIRFGIDQPKPKSAMADFAAVASDLARNVGRGLSSLAKEFVHAVGPLTTAGLIALAAVGAAGLVAMKSEVHKVFDLKPSSK